MLAGLIYFAEILFLDLQTLNDKWRAFLGLNLNGVIGLIGLVSHEQIFHLWVSNFFYSFLWINIERKIIN